MSYRRLWVLVDRLPAESWTQTQLRDDPPADLELAAAPQTFGPWALDNYQMASLLDAVRHLEYTLAVVNGNEWTPPEPSPRPGTNRPKLKQTEASISYLKGLRAKGA